jgi:hypothetical protein
VSPTPASQGAEVVEVVEAVVLLAPSGAVLVVDVVELPVDELDVLFGAVVVVVLVVVVVDAVLVTVVVGVVVDTAVVVLAFLFAEPPKNVDDWPLPVIERPDSSSGTVMRTTTIAKASRPVPIASSHRGCQLVGVAGVDSSRVWGGAVSVERSPELPCCESRGDDGESLGAGRPEVSRSGFSCAGVVSCGAAVVCSWAGSV